MFWLIPISGILNFLLGLIVWLRKPKDPIHYIFFIFVLTTVLSISLDFIFRFYSTLLILRSAYAAASLIPLALLVFILELCGIPFNKYKFWRKLFFSLPTLIICISCFIDGLIIENIYELTVLGYRGELGPLFTLYSIYYFVYLAVIVFILSKKHKNSNEQEKKQITFASLGIFLYAVSATTFSLVLPTYFGIFSFTLLDAPSLIFFVSLMAYVIIKLGLFNIKVIATEIIVFSSWIILLIQVILSNSSVDRIISSSLLISMVAVGILLIRSVIKEVQLREEIQKLADDLKLANENQASLMHFMNHQVKGRFGNAKNIFAELLTDDYGEIPEFARPLLQKGLEETTMGVNYVQNILKGASAENGTLPYEMKIVNIKEILEKVASQQKLYAENKNLKFELKVENGDYSINGDPLQLGEAIKNMIDNSINYTLEGGVFITLSAKNNKVLLEIKDTGVGITEEDKPKLFKAGTRGVDSVKININSTGYGLAFVKGVVDAHKGRVWVESEGKNKGSTFYLEIPKKS